MNTLLATIEARRKMIDSQTQTNKPCHQSKIQLIKLNENGSKTKRFIVMSDTHLHHSHIKLESLVKSDTKNVLLHCGDFTDNGSVGEISKFVEYLKTIQHYFEAMIIICGNHEAIFALQQKEERNSRFQDSISNVHYLEDEMLDLDGIKIYGSPWVPNMSKQKGEEHMKSIDNSCFYANDTKLTEKFKQIPDNVQILLTHTPADGILDNKFGSIVLKQRLKNLQQLRVHCFGHIHMKYGVERNVLEGQQNECTFINAAMDEDEQPFYFDVLY